MTLSVYFWSLILGGCMAMLYNLVFQPIKEGSYRPGIFNITASVVSVYLIYFILFKFDLIHKIFA